VNFEQIILILTTLGLREALGYLFAWLKGRRGEKLDDVSALWEENRALRKDVDDLSDRLLAAQTEIAQLRGLFANVRQWGDLNCPYDGERCSLRGFFHMQALSVANGGAVKGG